MPAATHKQDGAEKIILCNMHCFSISFSTVAHFYTTFRPPSTSHILCYVRDQEGARAHPGA